MQSQRFVPAAEAIAREWGTDPRVVVCDVTCDQSVSAALETAGAMTAGRLDAVLHSVAYAPPAAMKGYVSMGGGVRTVVSIVRQDA